METNFKTKSAFSIDALLTKKEDKEVRIKIEEEKEEINRKSDSPPQVGFRYQSLPLPPSMANLAQLPYSHYMYQRQDINLFNYHQQLQQQAYNNHHHHHHSHYRGLHPTTTTTTTHNNSVSRLLSAAKNAEKEAINADSGQSEADDDDNNNNNDDNEAGIMKQQQQKQQQQIPTTRTDHELSTTPYHPFHPQSRNFSRDNVVNGSTSIKDSKHFADSSSVVLSYMSDSEREEGDEEEEEEELIDIDDSGCQDDASSASGSNTETTHEDGQDKGKTISLFQRQ